MQEQIGKVALVTGANRGIGLEVVRRLARLGFKTLLGSRDAGRGKQAAGPLSAEGLDVVPVHLDVTGQESVDTLKLWVEERYGKLDVLVNNAAVLYDSWQSAVGADMEIVREAFETNTMGPWRVSQAFLPLLRRSGGGRIVNVSSESGSLAGMGGGTPAYSVSKAALNVLTRKLADELRGERILVNSVCPGWVATEMGGLDAPRTVEEGAKGVVWAATLPDTGPTGGFFRDGEPLPW